VPTPVEPCVLRHCKRLGPGLARWQCHALRAWHTRGCRIGLHRCRVGLQPCPLAAFDARRFFMSDAGSTIQSADATRCTCGFAAALHSVYCAVCWQAFYSAKAFNQNIGSWNTASVTTMYQAWSLLQFSALTLCVGACRSCLVRHGLKVCAVPSACASAAIAAASSRPASAAPRTESMLGKHCQRLSSRVF
jgi:surface protein